MVYGLSLWFKVSFFFQKHFLKRARAARAHARVVVSFCRDSELGGKNEDRI